MNIKITSTNTEIVHNGRNRRTLHAATVQLYIHCSTVWLAIMLRLTITNNSDNILSGVRLPLNLTNQNNVDTPTYNNMSLSRFESFVDSCAATDMRFNIVLTFKIKQRERYFILKQYQMWVLISCNTISVIVSRETFSSHSSRSVSPSVNILKRTVSQSHLYVQYIQFYLYVMLKLSYN